MYDENINKKCRSETKVKKSRKREEVKKLEEEQDPRPLYKYPLFDRMALRLRSDKELDVVAEDLITWSQQDDSVVFESFTAVCGITPPKLHQFAARHAKLADAIQTAKHIIGARREARGLEGKYNASIVLKLAPLYNAEYREWLRERAKSAETVAASSRFVVLEKMPSSDLVPERKPENPDDESDIS